MDAGVRCHSWCHTRQGWGCAGDQQRHLRIAGRAQAYAVEAGAVYIISVRDAVEAQLVLEQVSQEPGEASGGQGLPTSIIDPGAVMG
jgi:hypothetical protein